MKAVSGNGLSDKRRIRFQIGCVRPVHLNLPIGMTAHQSCRTLHNEALRLTEILKLHQSVVIVAVSIGDHKHTGRLLPVQA